MAVTIPDSARLDSELRAAGCTFDGCATFPPGANPAAGGTLLTAPDGHMARITPTLPSGQLPAAQGVVDGFIWGDTQVRLAFDIFQDLGTLTGAQITAIWTDLTSGTPPKFGAYYGVNS